MGSGEKSGESRAGLLVSAGDLVKLAAEMRTLGVAEFTVDGCAVRFMPYEVPKPEPDEAGAINALRAGQLESEQGKAIALEFHSA